MKSRYFYVLIPEGESLSQAGAYSECAKEGYGVLSIYTDWPFRPANFKLEWKFFANETALTDKFGNAVNEVQKYRSKRSHLRNILQSI